MKENHWTALRAQTKLTLGECLAEARGISIHELSQKDLRFIESLLRKHLDPEKEKVLNFAEEEKYMTKLERAIDQIRNAVDDALTPLSAGEKVSVLESVAADIDGNLEAAKIESEEEVEEEDEKV